MQKWLCAALFLVAVFTPSGLGQEPAPKKEPRLASQAKQADSLAPVAQVEGYDLQPPKDQPFKEMPAPAGAKMFSWGGNLRPDKTAPAFMVLLMKPPKEQADKISQEQFLQFMLKGVEARRTDWKVTKPERVEVNGLTFLRARWSGTDAAKNWKMHGIMWVAIDGPTFIQIHCQDVEPNHTQALKTAEAAVKTFKKRK